MKKGNGTSENVKFVDRDVEVTLYKQPQSKNYYCSFQWKGKQYRKSTRSQDMSVSKQFCYRLVEQLTDGKIADIVPESLITFSELFEKFLIHKKNSRTIQDRTLDNYRKWGKTLLSFSGEWIVEQEFRRYGVELYGTYLKYRQTDGRQEYQYFTRDGKKYRGKKLVAQLSGSTLNCEMLLLHNVLNYGKHYLNILNGWNVPKFGHYRQPENDEIVCPTKVEYIEMKKYFREHNRPDIELWMRVCSNVGLRPGEMENLKVADIDFSEKILFIRNRKQKRSVGRPLTTLFPITDRLKPTLTELLELTSSVREKSKSDFLFLNLKTGRKLANFKKTWSTMLDRLDLDKRYTPKTMRRYFITKVVKESIVPLSIISTLVGHTNTFTLQKHYLHLRVDDSRTILEYMYQNKEDRRSEEDRRSLADRGSKAYRRSEEDRRSEEGAND